MQKPKRLIALLLSLLLMLTMSQIPIVFATEGINGHAETVEPMEETPNPTEDTTPVVTEDTPPATTEDTTPEVTEDTSPVATDPTGPAEPETSFVTISGITVDELNEPLAGCEFHLVAVDGSELPDDEWEKLDFAFEKSEFCFDIPANVEYRVLVTHESKQYAEYKTVLIASENTDLGNVVIPFAKLKLTFTLVNAKAKCLISDAQGGNISNVDTDEANPITVSYGSSVFITFYPASGCQLPEQVEVNGTKVNLVDNGYKIMSCTADADFAMTANDITAPAITNIEIADKDTWTQSKIVTITATDNINSTSELQIYTSKTLYVTTADVTAKATLLPDHKDVVTENAVFYVYAIDAAGNMKCEQYEVTKIDRTAPVITDFQSNTGSWTIAVVYTAHIEDNTQLARVYWVSHLGIEHDLNLTADGNYEFTVYYNGTISLIAEDVAGNRTTVSTTVENIDNDPPVISDIVVQERWDAEKNLVMFSATDNVGIDSVEIIDTAGDKTKITLEEGSSTYRYYATANGTYTIKATDTVGNQTTAQFEVNRIDTEAPVIASISRTPDQDWTNESITVSVVATDSQSGVDKVYIIATSELTETTTLDQWQVMTPNDAGQYEVVIENSKNINETYHILCVDKVGRLSNRSQLDIRIDIAPPVISDISLDAETWAQQITYTFHVEDNGAINSVSWVTPSAIETSIELDDNGIGTMTVTENGEHKVVAIDKAGNMSEVPIIVELIDREKPTIVSIEPQKTWDASENTAYITAEDNREIQKVYVVSGDGSETTLNGSDGVYVFTAMENGSYFAYVIDVAGNETSEAFTIDHIDTQAPEISNVTIEPEVEWSAESVKITLTGSDSQSGVRTIRVITQSVLESDDAPEMDEWEALPAEENGNFVYIVQNDVDSNETYHFVCEDNVGRFSALVSYNIKIDITAPSIFDIAADTDIWNREINYTFKVTDNCAMQSVKYTSPNGQVTTYELSENAEYGFTAIENGEYVVTATDMAGNQSTKTINVSKVDRVNPVIERIVPQSTWDATKNTAEIIASDNAQMQRVYVTDAAGNEFTLVEAQSNHYTFTTLLNGTYTVTAVDVAGNTDSAQFTIDHIDTEIPTITSITKDPDVQWTTHSVKVTVIPADSQSGVKAVYAAAESIVDPSEDVSKWTLMQKTSAGYVYVIPNDKDSLDTYHFIVEDNVGRFSEIETFVIGIDVTAPETVKVTYAKGELTGFFKELSIFSLLYRDYVTVNAAANDLFCGVNRYEYQIVREGESLSDSKWKAMPLTNEGEAGNATVVIRETDFIGSIYVRVYDNLGNCTQAITDTENGETVICVLENTPDEYDQRSAAPALTTRTEKPDGTYEPGVWTKADVVVHGESEGPVSGVKLFQYQIVPVGQMLEESKWIDLEPMKKDVKKAEIRITEDANVDVYMRTVSNAENASKYSRVRVRVQKTLPQNAAVKVTGTMGSNNWYVGLPTITITPPQVDSMASPVTTYYSLIKDGDAAYTVVYGENKPVIREDGVYFLSVWTVDEAGNKCAKTYNETLWVDTTSPTDLTLKIGDESILAKTQGHSVFDLIYGDAVTVKASANCDISGMASLSYQKVYDNAAYSSNGAWTTWPRDGRLTINPNENCVIYLRAIDKAGNTTIVHSDGIIIDDTAPQGDGQENISMRVIGANANGFFAGDATVDVTIVDPVVNQAMSGLKTISYQVVTDGVVTQEETIGISSNGTNIAKVASETGNNGYVYKWNGRITIRAAANNSDNIIVKVTAVDLAGNRRTSSTALGAVKIDTTAPTAMLSYDNNRHQQHNGSAYFDENRTLTIVVHERDLGPASLTVTRNGQPYPAPLSWSKAEAGVNGDETTYTAKFTFSEDGDYRVKFDAKDLAGNSLAELKYSAASAAREAFVIDKTAPKISITYDNEKPGADNYFDAPRTATITVIDDNFDSSLFVWTASAKLDGKEITAPVPGAWAHDGNTHTVSVRFDKDGDYEFTCSCKDKAGNSNEKVSYGTGAVKNSFTIDLIPVDVVVEGLSDKTAYNGELSALIRYHDVNMKDYTLSLKVTNMETTGIDVTKEFIKEDADGEIRLVFPEDRNVDGIYVLEYDFYDKAAHKTSATYKFTVNRNGSVFEYSEDLLALLNNYVHDANGVYTVIEYNPGQVETRTITITRDGAPISDPQWNMENQDGSESKWHRYEYTVLPENFTEDGRYRITIASDDNAKNRTEATPDILFWVDKTAPELPLITGLEDDIVNANELNIKVQAYDTIGLAKILIELTDNDGVTKVLLEEEFEEGETGAERYVVIGEGLRQHLRVVVTDRAGNTIDTDSENFAPAYTYEKKVTVSENILTRWYADPWMFYGSIGGFAALIAVITVLLANAKKRKKTKN